MCDWFHVRKLIKFKKLILDKVSQILILLSGLML